MKGGRFIVVFLVLIVVPVRAGDLRIEPAVAEVPANHLKFYLHFPGPMERGEAFRHLRLVEIDGSREEVAEVPEPFREVELWDGTFTRMTLWFHPGRQKPGVNLNVEIGPILEAGKRYRLEISGKWRSEAGVPLGETVRHEFAAGPPDEVQPDPRRWRITVEGAFVRVEAGETLDPESLRKRVTMVREGRQEALPVKVTLLRHGFRLEAADGWKGGPCQLLVDPRLEDLAGNSVARLFNLDLDKETPGEAESTEPVLLPIGKP